MSTAFKVGVFAVATVLAIFVVWYVLSNQTLRRNSYQIAVHFRNVVGLQPGSSVQLAGVDVGIVDDISLLPDQTASVFCSIHSENTIYRGSIFTVTQTLTGAQSTLAIIPPSNLAGAVPLPRHPLPEAEQPEGTVPPTIADLVSEGQKRMADLDKTLAILNKELPGIVKNFNEVAIHTNGLIAHADRNFTQLGEELSGTVASVNTVVSQLNGLIVVNGRSISTMTTGMQQLLQTNGPKVAALINNLAATSENLNKTMASVQSIAADPSLKANLAGTAANLKDSSEKLKAIATDIQSITGDPKVQIQLKSTLQNLDETIEKANELLGNFVTVQSGGQAQPVPGGPEPIPSGMQPVPGASAAPRSQAPRSATGFHMGGNPQNPLELATGTVRLYWGKLPSGPSSDLDITVLPHFRTNLTFGANDLGYNTTYNFLFGMRGSPNLRYSFGVLKSNLGVRTTWSGLGPFGVRADLYDPKQPQLDLYGDIRLAQRLRFFYGEKSLMGPAAFRTPQFGLQLGY